MCGGAHCRPGRPRSGTSSGRLSHSWWRGNAFDRGRPFARAPTLPVRRTRQCPVLPADPYLALASILPVGPPRRTPIHSYLAPIRSPYAESRRVHPLALVAADLAPCRVGEQHRRCSTTTTPKVAGAGLKVRRVGAAAPPRSVRDHAANRRGIRHVGGIAAWSLARAATVENL
jgi:hypothetical protein